MLMPCVCNVYTIEVNDATYVNNGRPLCAPATCEMVREHGFRAVRIPLASPEECNDAA